MFTDRLELVPATVATITAELEGFGPLSRILDAEVPGDWPPGEYDHGAQEFFLARLAEGGPSVAGWYNWYAIDRGDTTGSRVLVGCGGYFGPPTDERDVEIGFSVSTASRCLGYATEIANALTAHAFADPRVEQVLARTAPDNRASRRVLEKCGFLFVDRDAEAGIDHFRILRSNRLP